MNIKRFEELMAHCCVRREVVQFECDLDEKFSATAYCLLDGHSYDEQCSLFIDKFSQWTSTNWISLKRIDSCVRYKFRKTFTCHLSKKNKKTYGRNYINKVRDKECLARVDFKWKHVNRSTIRNDPNLNNGLNCIVNINFDHTHSLTAMDTMAFLRSSKDTIALFHTYFEIGLSPSDAKNYHEICLIDNVVNEDLVPLHLTNAQKNPSIRQVIHINNTWKINHKPDDEFSYSKLTKLVENLAKQGTHMAVDKNTLTIALITPLMLRVWKELCLSEDDLTVWIENTDYSPKNTEKRFLTMFFVSSKVGALPIGCALHNSENTQIAFRLLKETMEKCANKSFSPNVIIAGDDIVQRIPQQLVFEGATNILSITKICQDLWKWLGFSRTGVDKGNRKTVLRNFMKIVFSQSIESASNEYKLLCSSMKEFPLVIKHLEFMWFRRSEWCLPFRNQLPKAVINFKNCEMSIRILKGTLLLLCKNFNPYALINVICNSLEKYNIDRLARACIANSKVSSPHYSKYMKPADMNVVKVAECEHQVLLSTGKLSCSVYTDIAMCDCVIGRTGQFCEHLAGLTDHLHSWLNYPEILPEDVTVFNKLTTGLKLERESHSLSQDEDSIFVEDVFDFEDFKTEEIEINDVRTPMPYSSEEQDYSVIDSPFINFPVKITNSPANKVVPIVTDVSLTPEEFKPEEIEITDVCMTPIANFFEDTTDPEDCILSNKELNTSPYITEVGNTCLLKDQGPNEEDDPLYQPAVTLVNNCQPASGNICESSSINEVPITNEIRDGFSQIVNLISLCNLPDSRLQEFNNVLKEIKTPDQAKIFCQEVTKMKQLKRLGFKLPTLKEQQTIATRKMSKLRTHHIDE